MSPDRMARHDPRAGILAGFRRPLLLAACLAMPAVPAAAQEEETGEPREPAAFYQRLEERRGTGDGIFITRPELEMMDVRSVRSAISLRARQPFRTRGGASCEPAVFWNGLKLDQRWDPNRSREARTPVDVIEGIEIYYADWMDLPLIVRGEECGAILLWSRPELADADSGTTLIKVGLVLVAGVVFFLLVGS